MASWLAPLMIRSAQLRSVPFKQTREPARQAMATWTGKGLSQEDFMQQDTCITVDESDNILGSASKRAVHIFDSGTPNGQLHRAFSMFLFDRQNRLLLQQRAASKVTFPGVWTNTCCSHQLHGHDPNEVDGTADVAHGHVPGACHAATRKLEHELGIPPSQLDISRFRFLTRLLYCAADRDPRSGEATGWGEHELDYIIFARQDVTLSPNADEVGDTRWVAPQELREMMRPESGLRWSPWFRIIAEHFLFRWWEDLDAVLLHGAHADFGAIHKLSC